MASENVLTLDLKGLKCPLPVLRTRKFLRNLISGETVRVETTDPLAVLDIAHMCQEDGHVLLSHRDIAGGHEFVIAKK
jgi:tRNA 2-thiouridine synthesizing protein A